MKISLKNFQILKNSLNKLTVFMNFSFIRFKLVKIFKMKEVKFKMVCKVM